MMAEAAGRPAAPPPGPEAADLSWRSHREWAHGSKAGLPVADGYGVIIVGRQETAMYVARFLEASA
jgi:hypothetical protein